MSEGTARQRRFGREAVIYGLGMVLSRAASIIMLPLYTRMLTPADYGLLQMLDMTVEVVSILVSAGAVTGVMRFYFKTDDPEHRRRVVGSAFLLLTALNLAGSMTLSAAAWPIADTMLSGVGRPLHVYLAAANFTVGSLSTVPLLLMQMEGRALLFSSMSLAKLVLQLSLNILFLVGFGWGPLGVLASGTISGVVVGGACVWWMLRRNGLHGSAASARDLVRFGWPYQVAAAGSFLLTFGDRFFLEQARGLAEVGLYGLAYQFGFMLHSLTAAPYFRAWNPVRFEIAHGPADVRDARYNAGLRGVTYLMAVCGTGIAIFVQPVLYVMSDAAFRGVGTVVPLILLAFLFQVWTDVVQIGIDVAERTKFATAGTWASVVLVVCLYALLIPRWGAVGAALATVAAYGLRFALFYAFAERLWPVRYEWGAPLRAIALASAVTVAYWTAAPDTFLEQCMVATGLYALFAVLLWTVVLRPDERRLAIDLAVRQLRRARGAAGASA